MKNVRKEIWEGWLASGEPILADGAMGTLLHERGVPIDTCFDELNLTRPELVGGIHRDYVIAGARLIATHTFGANSFKLAAHGLENRLEDIHAAAVRLARQAAEQAGPTILVAGSVGPLGVRLAPFGRVRPEQAAAAFRRQVAALVGSGVDLLLFETHTDVRELSLAIETTRSMTDLPIVASMTYTRDDRTLLGDAPAQVCEALVRAGADVIGANCSGGPAQLLRVLQAMRRAAPQARFSIMPNAIGRAHA